MIHIYFVRYRTSVADPGPGSGAFLTPESEIYEDFQTSSSAFFYRRYSFMTGIGPENLPQIFHTGAHIQEVLWIRNCLARSGSGSEMFVPDLDLDLSPDLDLNSDLSFMNINIANCSLTWSISSSIIYTFP